MRRSFALYFVALLVVAGLLAGGVRYWVGPARGPAVGLPALTPPEGWSEFDWPFLNDQFGKGRAFECSVKECGDVIRVTFRAKIGFCNCATGVSDDEELERIGDVGLAGANGTPLVDGNEIRVGRMEGRSRAYQVETGGEIRPILSIGYNDRCDVIVVTAWSPAARPLDIEGRVLKFLRSDYVRRWAELTLGL